MNKRRDEWQLETETIKLCHLVANTDGINIDVESRSDDHLIYIFC